MVRMLPTVINHLKWILFVCLCPWVSAVGLGKHSRRFSDCDWCSEINKQKQSRWFAAARENQTECGPLKMYTLIKHAYIRSLIPHLEKSVEVFEWDGESLSVFTLSAQVPNLPLQWIPSNPPRSGFQRPPATLPPICSLMYVSVCLLIRTVMLHV